MSAGRLAGAVATEVRNDLFNNTGVHKARRLLCAKPRSGRPGRGHATLTLYFFSGLSRDQEATLLNVYLAFRVAKLLAANPITRTTDKVKNAMEGNR